MRYGFLRAHGDNSVEWYTPRRIFDALGLEFDLDPCSPGRAVVPWIPARRHIVLPENGLAAPWTGRVWLNPPYGRDTRSWLERLAGHGNGVALVFARLETKWFQEVASTADVVCFVRGRISFEKSDNCPGHPDHGSVLLAWGADNVEAVRRSGLGVCCTVDRSTVQTVSGLFEEVTG